MKRITKTVALLLIGGSTFLSSCVSEDISPEVEELRQAQIGFLQAKAALELAKADHEAAQTALLQLEIEYQQAVMQAQIDGAIADIDAQIAAAQQRAAEAELALQKAIDDLANQVNETAQEYLALYQGTMAEANSKLQQIIELEGVIARYNANLDAQGNIIDFERVAVELNEQIAEDSIQIVALESAVERLQGLNTDVSDVEEELAQVENRLDEVMSARATLQMEMDLAINALQPVYNDLLRANNLMFSEIPSMEATVASLEQAYAEQQEVVESFENQLAPFQAELEAVQQNYLPAQEKAEDLLEVWIQAKAQFEAAAINNQAGDEVYDDALAALEDAVAGFEAFAGAGLGNYDPQLLKDNRFYLEFLTDPSSEFGQAVGQYTNVLNDPNFQRISNRFSSELQQLNNLNWNLFYESNDLNNAQIELANIFEENEVETYNELAGLYNELYAPYNNLRIRVNELNSEANSLFQMRSALLTYLNGTPSAIANRIEALQSQIAMLEEDIAQNESALANNEIDEQEWAAAIVRAEERLDRLTTEYNALIALANHYLEQFNDVVAED